MPASTPASAPGGQSTVRATALDLNGYPTDEVQSGPVIQLKPNTLYYHLDITPP